MEWPPLYKYIHCSATHNSNSSRPTTFQALIFDFHHPITMPEEGTFDYSLAEGFVALQKSRSRKHRIIYGDRPPEFHPPEGTIVNDDNNGITILMSCALVNSNPREDWYDPASHCTRRFMRDFLWPPMQCSIHERAMHAHIESVYRDSKTLDSTSEPKLTVIAATGSKPLGSRPQPGKQFRKRDLLTDVIRPENPRPLHDEPPVTMWEANEEYILSNCQTVGWEQHTLSHPHHSNEAPVDWQLGRQDLTEAWCTIHDKMETFQISYYGRQMPIRQTFEYGRMSGEPFEYSPDGKQGFPPITITPVTQTSGMFRLSSAISPLLPQEPVCLQACDGDGPPPDFPWFDPDRAPVGWIPASSRKLGSSWCEKHGKDETGTKRDYLPVPLDRTTQRSYRPYIDDPREVRKQPLFSEAPTRVSEGFASAVTTTQPPSNA